jgi:hypothetical protein
LALFGTYALAVNVASAQAWQTVDDYIVITSSNNFGGGAYAITKDPSGNLYAAGWADNTSPAEYGNFLAMIRKSADGGATWSVVDRFWHADSPGDVYNGIAADRAGILYAVGEDLAYPHWFVRRSLDAGLTWQTVDDFGGGCVTTVISTNPYRTEVTCNNPGAYTVATDLAGNVYVAGYSNQVWVVRKSVDQGNSWSTVDVFNPGVGAGARAVLCHPTAGVFVAGDGYVRQSLDGGTNWTTVDESGGSALGADAIGGVYSVGTQKNGHWIVRRSSYCGACWTTVDDFQPPPVTTVISIRPYRT